MKLILFDFDGTLVDSQHIICMAMDEAFAACGLASPGRERTLSIVGLSLPEVMARLAAEHDEAGRARLVEAYRAAFLGIRADPALAEPMFPGAREAIEGLAARPDVVLGIVTGKARRGLDAVLKRVGLGHHFMTLQTADDAPSKPHPAMVEQAMAEVGMAPAATVVVGDTAFDMAMARAAGASAIGVSWGYHAVPELIEAGAQIIVDGFDAVPAAVDALLENASEHNAELGAV